jgi:ABC-type transporter Mla subunit MlaD
VERKGDRVQWLRDLFALPTNVRRMMATLEEVQAQVASADEATNNIANDVAGLKSKLDAAIADTQGQVAQGVSDALQAVSDGLGPVVDKLQGVAASTEDESQPENPPVEPESV